MARFRITLGEWLGGVAVLALSVGPWTAAIREVFETAQKHLEAKTWIALGVGVSLIALSCQYSYWRGLVPWLRRRRRARSGS